MCVCGGGGGGGGLWCTVRGGGEEGQGSLGDQEVIGESHLVVSCAYQR